MTDPATRTLLCYGDSNTHGTLPLPNLDTVIRMAKADRWTTHLARLLPDWEVIAEGHNGRTTVHDDPIEGAHRNGMTILPAILESHAPVDVVLLMLGTNDLKPRFSVQAADIALSLERMVRAILASGCGPGGAPPQLLLVAPPPIEERGCLAEMFAGGAAKSQALAPAIAAVAARLGVAFLDAGPLVRVSATDGIHYDAAAMPALARAFAAATDRHFPALRR
jgi:lysophospholipase L1-like esterase